MLAPPLDIMSAKVFWNGYTKVPTIDPDAQNCPYQTDRRSKRQARGLRPGFFYMFGERGRYVAEPSESEEIEMQDMKRTRRLRHKKPRSPKSPKVGKPQPKLNVIHEPIQPDDTVQRVALRYGCPVSVS